MDHLEIINYLIQKHNYKSYLEIGVAYCDNFARVNIDNKECCDISDKLVINNTKITYLMTSDEMFAQMPVDKKYDIIFIDGMHSEEYVDRDIINSLKHLNKGGCVCVHDTIPNNVFMQQRYTIDNISFGWTGDVWKSITKLQQQNIEFYTIVNYDVGLTVIKYYDNPYSLNVPNYLSKIDYSYIFKNTYDYETCLTEQGKYVMHVINDDKKDIDMYL